MLLRILFTCFIIRLLPRGTGGFREVFSSSKRSLISTHSQLREHAHALTSTPLNESRAITLVLRRANCVAFYFPSQVQKNVRRDINLSYFQGFVPWTFAHAGSKIRFETPVRTSKVHSFIKERH